jgi:outer membrane protein insertion porin family
MRGVGARPGSAVAVLLALALAVAGPAFGLSGETPPLVTATEVVSPHPLPEPLVRASVHPLVGRPRQRGAVRERVEQLWTLGLFSQVTVEEVEEPGGVRLVFRLERRPHVRRIAVTGDLGIESVDIVKAIGLGVGDGAAAERLERARRDVLALYEREGFFRPEVAVDTRTDPTTNGVDLTFAIRAGSRARVGAVDVEGAGPLATREITRARGLRVGDAYRESRVREAVEQIEDRLRAAGFAGARIEAKTPRWDLASNTVTLLLLVAEGPRVTLEFEGNQALGDSTLRERVGPRLAGSLDEAEIAPVLREVETVYREAGYPSVRATGSLRREGNEVTIRVTVVEGRPVAVASIGLPGAPPALERSLREQLATRPERFLSKGPFVEETLDRDVQGLTALLRARGYPEARVGPATSQPSDDGRHMRVDIPIDPGPLTSVGRVEISGAAAIASTELGAALGLRPGAPWDPLLVEEARRIIVRRYARLGQFGVDVQVRVTPRGDMRDVTIDIREGVTTRIGSIVVRGLVQTREDVVRRELRFAPGQPLDPEVLLEAQRRLSVLGIFESVEVEPLRPPSLPFVEVVVTVREGQPWHLDAGVGYQTFYGFRATVEAGHDNLFGTGRSLGLQLRVSQRGNLERLVYREPWLFGTRWLGELTLFHEASEEIGYDLRQVGLLASIQRDLWPERMPGLRGLFQYSLVDADRFNIDDALLEENITPGRQLISALSGQLTLERRNRPFDPTRGSFHLVGFEIADRVLGSQASFIKGRLETAWFFDWLAPTVLAVSARLGLAAPLAGDTSLPIERRFFAGGAGTVRGYEERKLGPLDADGDPLGGNAAVVLNVEWRVPIWRWIWGAAFFDTGAVTSRVRDLSLSQFKSGIGGGLRLATPVGPVRLDIGYPLNVIPGEERKVQVYIAVGFPF